MVAGSNPSNFPFEKLKELLACPACESELRLDEGRLVCARCGRTYPIVDGIPVLIADRG